MNTFKLEYLTQTERSIITNESNLSVCLKPGGFIFAIIDKNISLKAIGEFSVNLSGSIPQIMTNVKTCFSSIGIHIFNFYKIKIICPTEKSTWIPVKLYDNSKDKEYLQTTNTVLSSDTVISNVCTKTDAVNIFAFPLHKYSGLKIIMPKASYISPSQVITEYAFDISSMNSDTVVLNKREDICDIAIFKGNTFTLSNSFKYKNPEDFIYFILYTLQQLNIDTSLVNMAITGDAYSNEELHLLQRYIKHVAYANCTENVSISEEFNSIDMQQYFLLLA